MFVWRQRAHTVRRSADLSRVCTGAQTLQRCCWSQQLQVLHVDESTRLDSRWFQSTVLGK